MAKSKTVPADEDKQTKFRRVANSRLLPLVKRYKMIKGMIGQPIYAPSEQDLKNLKNTLNKYHDETISQIDKALSGALKPKKEEGFEGINWEKEPEEESTDESDDETND